jgi:hypothetical protein
MEIKLIEKYEKFVKSKVDKHPHGNKSRGWVKLGLYFITGILAIIIIWLSWITFKWWGLVTLTIFLIIIEIILRVVDKGNK